MEKYLIHKFSKKLLQKSIFSHLLEYLRWRSGVKEIRSEDFAPISINLDLTTTCNYQCSHCIDSELLNTGQTLNLDYVKTTIKDWSKKGLKSVILIGGGEPCIYPYFEEVIKFLKSCSLQIAIVSNGTRIDRIENISGLLDKKDWVRFSLDAATDKTFQKIHHPRLNITLEKIMADVRKLRKKNPKLQIGYSFLVIGDGKYVNGIPLLNNIKEISLATKLAKENGFNYLSVKPFITPKEPRETTISNKNLKAIKNQIKEAKKFEDDKFKVIESVNLLCFYDENLKKAMQNQPKICHAQFFRWVVIPAGIFQCSLWRGFDEAKLIDTNQKITKEYYQKLHQKRLKMIDSFNAKQICKEVNCLYAPFNYWVEDLINHPEKIKELKPVNDFDDYFL